MISSLFVLLLVATFAFRLISSSKIICPELPGLETKEIWRVKGVHQTLSSPRTIDLNGDNILDIVIGSGSELDEEGAITAFDGSNGQVLWSKITSGEMFGSAQFADLNGDEAPDVILGGRGSQLFAINGVNGKVLWKFDVKQTQRKRWFQFYTGQFIPDINNDGIVDWLTANGGDPRAQPYAARDPNYLMIISGKDGQVLAVADTPDEAETYMSVYFYSPDGVEDPIVVFGTGGETRAGSLWQTSLKEIIAGDISNAQEIIPHVTNKGFIAPPALVDFNADDVLDIVATAFDGQVTAIDGQTKEVFWAFDVGQAETYATPAIGYFTPDEVPDVLAYYSKGTFPNYKRAEILLIGGKTGEITWSQEWENNYGFSPLAIDINDDGRDEVILGKGTYLSNSPQGAIADFEVSLLDTCRFTLHKLQDGQGVTASTPVVIDLEGDGKLELIYAYFNLESVWQLIRLDLNIATPKRRAWAAYLGSNYDGKFQPKTKIP